MYIAADDISKYWLFVFETRVLHFMQIVLLRTDSHGISFFFSERKNNNKKHLTFATLLANSADD